MSRHVENFFRGWNAIGVASNPQPNAGDATGAFYSTVSLNAKNQSRSTASDAYYRPIVGKRPNFHLITGQSVTKINLDHKKRAISVNVGRTKPVKHASSYSELLPLLVSLPERQLDPFGQGEV